MSSMRLTLGNFTEHGPGAGGRASLRIRCSAASLHETVAGSSRPRAVAHSWPRRARCRPFTPSGRAAAGVANRCLAGGRCSAVSTTRSALPALDGAQWALPHRLGAFPRCLPTAGRAPFPQPPSGADRSPAADPAQTASARRTGSRISLIEALAGTSFRYRKPAPCWRSRSNCGKPSSSSSPVPSMPKSPYTGGHCQRVPELARMLTQAATAQQTGPTLPISGSTKRGGHPYRELAARLRQGPPPGVRGGQGDQAQRPFTTGSTRVTIPLRGVKRDALGHIVRRRPAAPHPAAGPAPRSCPSGTPGSGVRLQRRV